MKFKKGEVVIFLDDKDFSSFDLVKGTIYTVKDPEFIYHSRFNGEEILVEGAVDSAYSYRFELVSDLTPLERAIWNCSWL